MNSAEGIANDRLSVSERPGLPDPLVCDHVEIEEPIYTFIWNGYGEEAELIEDIEDDLLRFAWARGRRPC